MNHSKTNGCLKNSLKIIVFTLSLAGYSTLLASTVQPKEATPATVKIHNQLLNTLPFSDKKDFKLAQKGLIAKEDHLLIRNKDGRVVWDLKAYSFLDPNQAAPKTVNPSLWRQAVLNMYHGLYKVTDNIYQVRGYDLSNITFVKGNTGWIVFDPLTTKETAKAAYEFLSKNLGKFPIVAVIYSHSHADHFGGIKGIVSEKEVKEGKVKIIAPDGFMHHAVAENVIAGNAMSRRATYQYGTLLKKGPTGQVDAAIGKNVSTGTVTLIAPTIIIKKTMKTLTIDGVKMVFQLTPGTEAPAEMNTYFPQLKALWMAENTVAGLHNVYTLRGAEVRDALAWSKYINQTIQLFGGKAKVLFASHSWPRWGNPDVLKFLKKQRDLYGYLHDQTLHLMNQGYTMTEIAEKIKVPKSLSHQWYNRGYHGSYNHNIKAIYQKYLGWYNSNPATLNPLPPTEAAKMYVKYMGGADKVLTMARDSFKAGQYRWVAMVVNQVILADPTNKAARNLQADTLEQLGYQAESAGWRNSYLMAAKELRDGVIKATATKTASEDTLKAMSVSMFLDYLGVQLNGSKATGKHFVFNLNFPDIKKQFVLTLENSHLSHMEGKQSDKADATLTLSRMTFNKILSGQETYDKGVKSGQIKVQGKGEKFKELLSLLEPFKFWFNIVTPN